MLNRHIHTLRKRIRRFEERFEQEKHYKVRRRRRKSELPGQLDSLESC